MAGIPIEHRIRIAGLLIAAGLIIQLLTLTWSHPLAFIAFLVIGTPIVAAGALFYLYSLARGNWDTGTNTNT